MIRHIKLLQNIGTFDSNASAAMINLKRLVLVYSDNGRGKTTLAAILRSLETGDPAPIVERRRLGSQHPPKVVLDCEGNPSNVMFLNGAWNQQLPHLKIYDDVFVEKNVYSGLSVDPHHRQNLHELVLGDEGVTLNRSLQELVSRNEQHISVLKEKGAAIPEQPRRGLSLDEFCDLPELSDIEVKIEASKRMLLAARSEDAVRTTTLFKATELPAFDVEAISRILLTDLPDLDREAEVRVQAHIQTLGRGGESWVAEGMRRKSQDTDGICPFCGQDLISVDLIAHYRSYFSEGYNRLKRDVEALIESIGRIHADGVQTEYERSVGAMMQLRQFWLSFCEVPDIEIDTKAMVNDWNAARDAITELLKSKQAAPLERQTLSKDVLKALADYETHRQHIESVNEVLMTCNSKICEIQKQVKIADVDTINGELSKLKATEARYSQGIAPLCAEYLQEKEAKTDTENKRDQAREALKDYRSNVFPTLQAAVNQYLSQFNSGFHLDNFVPQNIRSGSTCTYNVMINDMAVAIGRSTNSPNVPSFRNTLSAGDRNTLALALFFSSLDQNPDLADTVVVIDDPMSSLDDHRSLTTVQSVRNLVERTSQVIVLSHSKRFLCGIWRTVNSQDCVALEIAATGSESVIRTWDVSEDSLTEHDNRHFLLRDYAHTGLGSEKESAAAIRLHLEGFLRVACPSSFPPGKLLGQFLHECQEKVGRPDEVLNEVKTQELQRILEYANQFHHDTNPAWETTLINSTELRGFVLRTLDFVGPPS